MYAVVRTGGKQYRVAKNDTLRVERLAGETGDIITIGDVLMLADGSDVTFGAPLVDGVSVAAEIVEQARAKKIVIFKKRRRQNYRRKKGHRQLVTVLRVTEILTDGKKPAKKAAAKKTAAKKPAKTAPDIVDDVSLIDGVGPVLKEKLAGYGVTSLKELAAMSASDVETMDEALELHGRASRDEWVKQAKALLAGKAPRAKIDKARAAKAGEE